MRDKILVIGGYGQVGRVVTVKLLEIVSNKIVIAGRSIKKAKAFAKELHHVVETLMLDVYDEHSRADALKNVRAVVMCLTPKSNDFAEYCIQNGIYYVDISPSFEVTKTIKQLHQKAAAHQSTCVLGVGIAPGLSNLLVKELNQQVEKLQNIRISLLLGVGEQHGPDGVKWLLDNINCNFFMKERGAEKELTPFVHKNKTQFMHPLGKRTAYAFNLADQFILQQTLPVENVSSYFCYDSRLITGYVSLLKRFGVFKLLRYKTAYATIFKLFVRVLSLTQILKMGTDIYGIQIDATGIKNGLAEPCHIGTIGNNNTLLTGQIAALVVKKLLAGQQPLGVFFIEELFSLGDFSQLNINIHSAFASLEST